MRSINELREKLGELRRVELPIRIDNDGNDGGSTGEGNGVNPSDVADRYKQTRNEYLKRRFQQLVRQSLDKYDGTTESLPVPPSDQDKENLLQRRAELKERLREALLDVHGNNTALRSQYKTFCERREELSTRFSTVEKEIAEIGNPQNDEPSGDRGEQAVPMDTSDSSIVVTEEDIAKEDRTLAELTQRRSELEEELAETKAELAKEEARLEDARQNLEEARQLRQEIDPDGPTSIDQLEGKAQQLEEETVRLQEMSAWYKGAIGFLEKLSDLRVVGTAREDDALTLQIEIMGKHIVQIRMTPTDKRGQHVVSEATFVGSKTVGSSVPVPNETTTKDGAAKNITNASNTASFDMEIPGLEDLVKVAAQFEPAEGIKFIVQETKARIRALGQRANELSTLRTRYLTKIGRLYYPADGFGGEDQEVVCSLEDEGITVVLRLTPDCPIVRGSVYIDQIVGLGGWKEDSLSAVKDSINNALPRSPVKLVEMLTAKIKSLVDDGKVELPNTPLLPLRMKTTSRQLLG